MSDSICSMWIFNFHREKASIFLNPDATKDDMDHAIDSIRSQYSDADQKKISNSKCFEEVYNTCELGNFHKFKNNNFSLGFNSAVSNIYD